MTEGSSSVISATDRVRKERKCEGRHRFVAYAVLLRRIRRPTLVLYKG